MRHTLALAVVLIACGDDAATTPDAAPPDVGPDGSQPDGPPALPPITRAQAGGTAGPVVLVGDKLYIGVGPRLVVRDATAPATAPALGESPALRGVVMAVAVSGTRAYVAERLDLDSKIHVLDISDPTAITETGLIDLAPVGGFSVVHALAATATRLYAADQEQGIFELDLTTPDAPTQVRLGGSFGATNMQLVGTRLYYWGGGFGGVSVTALDTTDGLAVIGEGSLPGANGVAITNNLAIVAGIDGIYVYDITDLANPVERFHHGDPDGGPFARAVAASGTTAWVPASNGLHVLDLTTPTAIIRTAYDLPTAGVNAATVAGGTLAYTTDRGRLFTHSTAAPDTATITPVTLCADCFGLTTTGGTLLVTDVAGGLRTAQLGDLSSIGESPALPGDPISGLSLVFEDVAIAGTTAYVADWLYGLRIYDVADPASPALLGSVQTGGAPSGVAIAGTKAFITEGTGGGRLLVYDVTNPALPTLAGSILTSKAIEVEVVGDIAYIADQELDGPGGLKLYNIANPAGIQPLGVYDEDCANALDVAVIGSTAVVACGGDGFHVVDVADPLTPTRFAVVPAPSPAQAWAVGGYPGHAVLGHDFGALVVDLVTPRAPVTVATQATASTVRAITSPAPGRIVASCGQGGVYQFDVP